MKGALLLLLLLAPVARAHNGFGIAPIYSEPTGLIVVDGSIPLLLKWTARESHADQFYRLRAQQSDFPPTPSPPSVMRVGTDLTTLAADALTYAVSLDLSTLPTGAWRIYADFDEPPFCVELEQVPALVVVQRPGDPPPFGVVVSAPILESPIVDSESTFTIEAYAASAVSVTIEAGDIMRDPAFPQDTLCVEFTWTPTLGTLMQDVPLVADTAAGPNRWRLDGTWDTRAVPDGAYLFRVTAKDADGHTQVIWARRFINVEHPVVIAPESDIAPEATAETSTEATAEVEVEARTSDDDGCTGGRGAAWWAALTALTFSASARARAPGSRRLARTDRSRRTP